MSYLKAISQWLVATLEPYGAPGLMLIAICDSSFLSLPEVNDAALMMLSINNPLRMWEYAAMTVLGSVIGCTLLYTVGRKGGEAMLQKRFAASKVERVRGWYKKYGMLAVIVPSLLPPPLPFKIFVLSAGAFQLPWLRFMTAVAIGRSARYFSEGILAVLYGKQAVQIVADNFPIVGMVLAGLIVAAAIVYVVARRRKPSSVGLILLPLLIMFFGSGCVRNTVVPLDQRMLKSFPFTKQQALERLETMSRSIQSLRASIELTGSTASLKEEFKRPTATLSGAVLIERPNRILLKGGITPISIFEMVSDGTKYQFYSTRTGELYTEGLEDGPPYKRFSHLGDLANQFVNLRPKQIEQALVLDVLALLNNPSIRVSAVENPVVQDRKKYLCVDFIETAGSKEASVVQRIWFDLSSENFDVSRRQTWKRTGELETDTKYAEYQSVPAGIRFPAKVEIQFAASDTTIEIGLNPKDAVFNAGIPADAFKFNNHPDAKIYKFEPADTQSISQQR